MISLVGTHAMSRPVTMVVLAYVAIALNSPLLGQLLGPRT